jgi:hypothetical protein
MRTFRKPELIFIAGLTLSLSGCSVSSQDEPNMDSLESAEISEDSESVFEAPMVAVIDVYDAESVSRSTNGAYYLSGEVSSNCSEIWVEAVNETSGLYDSYSLSEFQYGDSSFRYGIKEEWNNLADGENVYTFTAYCDGDQVVGDAVVFSYSAPIPTYAYPSVPTETYDTSPTVPSYDYSYPVYSDTNDSSYSTIEQLYLSGAYLLSTCDDSYTFLGEIGGKYDSESLFSKYDDYGSKYSDISIWDKYGDYGDDYSDCSAFSKYASEPPMVMIGDSVVAYLSRTK